MNELIKKIESQSNEEVWGNNSYNGSPEFEGYSLNVEKFAKLIVEECISNISESTFGGFQGDYYRKEIIENLKKKFSV
jgi:hypothetical protein